MLVYDEFGSSDTLLTSTMAPLFATGASKSLRERERESLRQAKREREREKEGEGERGRQKEGEGERGRERESEIRSARRSA